MPRMNGLQKLVLAAGVLLLVAILLWPEWLLTRKVTLDEAGHPQETRIVARQSFVSIFDPPTAKATAHEFLEGTSPPQYQIDTQRTGLVFLAALLVVSALIFALQDVRKP